MNTRKSCRPRASNRLSDAITEKWLSRVRQASMFIITTALALSKEDGHSNAMLGCSCLRGNTETVTLVSHEICGSGQ